MTLDAPLWGLQEGAVVQNQVGLIHFRTSEHVCGFVSCGLENPQGLGVGSGSGLVQGLCPVGSVRPVTDLTSQNIPSSSEAGSWVSIKGLAPRESYCPRTGSGREVLQV